MTRRLLSASRLLFALSVFAVTITGIASAFAHRPYFTQVERIVLPNGQPGELRIVNGDGIVGPDPQALLVLNGDNHVIARGPRSYRLLISCHRPAACTVFDLEDYSALELDPSTFKAAYVASDLDGKEPSEWWMTFYDNREPWGIKARDITVPEIFELHLALLNRNWIGFLFVVAMGVGAGLVGFGPFFSADPMAPKSNWAKIGLGVCRVFGVAIFMLASAFAGVWTGTLWLVAFFSGLSIAGAIIWTATRSARTAIT